MVSWNRDYVREKYKVAMLGVEGVYFPAKNPKRLLVFFSSMGKDRYDRYSWFWNDEQWDETSYLFIKDDAFHYFLGTDEKPMKDSVRKVIEYYQKQLAISSNETYMIGTSMGGYAAIYFAFYMKAKAAIVSNPQITFRATQMHSFRNWERHIREMGTQWSDLDLVTIRSDYVPSIYVEYGNYSADKSACESLILSLIDKYCLLIVRKETWANHTVNALFKETIERAVKYFEDESNRLQTD